MKQPAWKRFLSHFKEFHIESAPSELNPHLYVSLVQGRYQLSTQNAVYSFEDLYDNFYRAFQQLDWDHFNPANALLLGVGLGSIPQMLETKFEKRMRYTGVELDENVLYLANKYVLHTLESPFEMVATDAYTYVSSNVTQYDLICMDVFVDDVIPEELCTEEYLRMLETSLTDDGLLMYNRLSRTKDDAEATKRFLDDVFLPVFPEGGYLDVGGNWMLLNSTEYLRKRR